MSSPDTSSLLTAGQTLARNGSVGEARALFRAALALDPSSIDALLWLGATTDDGEEAVQLLTQATEIAPASARASAGLRWALERREKANGLGKRAAGKEEPTVSKQPLAPDPPALAGLASANIELQAQNQYAGSLATLIDPAIDDLDAGRLGAAIAKLEEAVRRAPESLAAFEQLGLAYYRADRLGDAEQVYRKMIALQPDHAEAHANLGLLMAETGRDDQAERAYRKALESEPGLEEVRLALADLLNQQGRTDSAVAEWRILADRNPLIVEFRVKIGDAYAEAGRFDESAAAYSRAIERNGDDPSLRLRLGRVLQASGRSGAALEQYREACRSAYASPECFVELATGLLEVGRDDEAWEAIDRALMLAPDDPEVLVLASRIRPRSRQSYMPGDNPNIIGPSRSFFSFFRR